MSRPLRRFLALGALLFALDLAGGVLGVARPAARSGASDRELLFEEALARGYARTDPIVRRRLARNLRFARSLEPGEGDEDALVREALALGMQRSDLVVRRRLVQKMELLAQEAARLEEPSDAELEAWLRTHAERFREPARVALTQVFFRSRARAEAALGRRTSDADAPVGRVSDAGTGAPDPLRDVRGDALPIPRRLPPHSRAELAARLGPALAAAAFALEPGDMAGPVRSAYGWHLIHVRSRQPARLPALATVRGQVRDALLAERGEAQLRQELARLRAQSGGAS